VVGGQPPTKMCKVLLPLGTGKHSGLALNLAADLALSADGLDDHGAAGQVTALRVATQETHGLGLGAAW
jgi:hypothetical protein